MKWLVGKLIAMRPFNTQGMIGILRVIWHLSRDFEVFTMGSNLFLLKFASVRDNERILDGSPSAYNNQMLAFSDFDGELRTGNTGLTKSCFGYVSIVSLGT